MFHVVFLKIRYEAYCILSFTAKWYFFINFLYIFFLRRLGMFIHYFRCRRCIWNPAPSHMRYTYIFIAVRSERWLQVGSGLQDPQQSWGRPAWWSQAYPHWILSVRLKSALAGTQTGARTIDPNWATLLVLGVGTRIKNSLVHCFPLLPGKVVAQF